MERQEIKLRLREFIQNNNGKNAWKPYENRVLEHDIVSFVESLLSQQPVAGRSELLRDYFAWHKEKGYVSHKPSDIDEFINEQ